LDETTKKNYTKYRELTCLDVLGRGEGPYTATESSFRPDDEFQKVAVDIFTEATPADQEDNQAFISLTDLKDAKYGDHSLMV